MVLETWVNDGAEPATVSRVMFNPFHKLLFPYWTVSIQCSSPCENLIKHHTKTPNVTLNFQMTRLNILWCSISLCPHYLISFHNHHFRCKSHIINTGSCCVSRILKLRQFSTSTYRSRYMSLITYWTLSCETKIWKFGMKFFVQ